MLLIGSCKQKEKSTTIIVKNTLKIARSSETVELSKSALKIEDLKTYSFENFYHLQIIKLSNQPKLLLF